MLYPDRGMLKWRGLILAEHADLIKEEFKNEKIEKKKRLHEDFDEQEQDIYNRIIYTSFSCQIPVRVEVQTFDEPIFGYGIVQNLNSFNGRLELEDGSYCIKDIVSLSLDEKFL